MRVITSLLLLASLSAYAQTPRPTRYIVELSSPAALAARVPRAALSEDSDRPLNIMLAGTNRLEHEQRAFQAHADAQGFRQVRRLSRIANVIIVEAPDGSEETLRAMPGVLRVAKDRRMKKHYDASIPLHQIDSAWAALGSNDPQNPLAWNTAGQGIKIGIIDTGIDPTHPAFQTSHLSMPAGYPRWNSDVPNNKTLTNSKIIVARSYAGQLAQDIEGHGTGVAQIAAGVPIQGPSGVLSGVAPAAWLGIYDVDSFAGGGYADSDILSALEDCVLDGMEVINMSFGAPDIGGAEDPINQTYLTAISALQRVGVVLVASAGNDGPDLSTPSSPAILSGVVAAGAQVSTTIGGSSSVTGPGGELYNATSSSTAFADASVTGPLANISQWDSTLLGCTRGAVWPKSNAALGKVLLIQRGTCNFSEKLENAKIAGAIGAIVYNNPTNATPDALISMDMSSAPPDLGPYPAVFVGNTDGQTLATALAHASAPYQVTLTFSLANGDSHLIADFSSRGPSADLDIKPDLAAAGQSVVMATCTDTTVNAFYNTCDPFGFQILDGTSFSAPLTTGSIAVLRSEHPSLSADDFRSLVINSTSKLLDDNGKVWPVQIAGSGSLNLLNAVRSTVTASPVSVSFGAGSGTVDLTKQIALKNISTTSQTYTLGIDTASAAAPALSDTTLTLDTGKSAPVSLHLTGASLQPGPYEGFLTVTPAGAAAPQARIAYWYAVKAPLPTSISFEASPLYVPAGSSTALIMRFIDDAGVPYTSPGPVSVRRLSGTALNDRAVLATSSSGATTVTFPTVYMIGITAASTAVSGDTTTFRVYSGDLVGDFTVVVQ